MGPRNRKRLPAALAALLFAVLPLAAQTLEGEVVNLEDGKPLPGTIIRVMDGAGKTLIYQMTDRTGRFSMKIPHQGDTLRVSLLGFEEKVFVRPFPSPLHIALISRRDLIREAVITAHKVVEAGDTIRYHVNALKRREDVVLGDMLKRLPGVELDDYGYVKYNGREINRFYVEGKDILENSYNLATRNLSVEAVKEVEILENHQPYKLLRGVRTSDQAALNIRLNEEARTKVNGGVEAGLGVADGPPAVSASARLSAFYVGKDFSSVDVGGFDNQGNALREPDLSTERDRSYRSQSLQERIAICVQQAPLEEKRALFNQTWEASTVDRLSFGEKASITLTAKYGRDSRESEVWNRSVYQVSGSNSRILDRTEENRTLNERFVGALSFKTNGSKVYVSDRLYADFYLKDGLLSVAGDADRLQQMDGQGWHVENDATTFFRIGDRVASVESFTQFSGLNEGLDMDAGIIGQQRDARLFYQRFALSGISRQLGWWRFSLTPEADYSVLHSSSVLAPFPVAVVPGVLEGRADLSLFRPALEGIVQYKKSPLEVSLDGAVRYSRYTGVDVKKSFTTCDLSGRIKYVTGRWAASLGSGIRSSVPDIQTFGRPMILTGYYTLWKGREGLRSAPQWSVTAEYQYRSPVSGWNLRIHSAYSQGRSFVSARELFDGYVLGYLTDETSGFKTLVSGAELSKGLYRWNGKWKLAIDHVWSQTDYSQDNQLIACQVQTLSPTASLSLSPIRWWGLTAECQASVSTYSALGFETKKSASLTVKTKQVFHFSATWSGGIGVDLYHFNRIGKTMTFPDLSLAWTGKKGLRLRTEAVNLLNERSFSFVSLSSLLEETYSYRIRPLTVLIGVDWRF